MPSPAPDSIPAIAREPLPTSEGMAAVSEILARFKLEQYASSFEDLGYDDLLYMLQMGAASEERLVQHVGFRVGHAMKYRHYMSALRAQHGFNGIT